MNQTLQAPKVVNCIGQQKPRVLILTSTLNMGGVETLILDTATEMVHRNFYTPVVCNLTGQGTLTEKFHLAGIQVFSFQEGKRFGIRLLPIRSLRSLIREQQIDIVHCHQLYAGIIGRLATFGLSIPLIYHTHNTTYRVGLFKHLVDNILTLTNTDIVVAVTEGMKEELIRRNWAAKDKTVVLLNAVDTRRVAKPNDYDRLSFRSTLGVSTDTKYVIGAIGRLEKVKGFDLLLDVFALMSQSVPNLWLVVVGDGSSMAELLSRAEMLGIESRITFTGMRTDIGSLMTAFDLLIIPSQTEAFPLVALEALSCGTPVLMTPNVSACEIFRGSVKVAKRNVDDLASAAILLLDEHNTRTMLSLEGKRLMNQQCSLRTYVDRLEEVYSELLI